MKKHIFLFAICIALFATSSFAQKFMKKGSLIANGAFSFETGKLKSEFGTSSSEAKRSSFALTPWAGYFITDDLGIGASLFVSTSKTTNDASDFESSGTTITFGPVVRYYFAEGPFAQAFVGFGSNSDKGTSGSTTFESKDGIFQYEAGIGYSVRISDTVLLDPMIGYGSQTNTDKDDSANKVIDSGIFIRIGFTVTLIAP